MAKKDDIILIIAKSFARQPLTQTEIELCKNISVLNLIEEYGLNDIQASSVCVWISHEFKKYDKEVKENLESLNEIFSWIKSKFKKGKTSKDINPTDILKQLEKVEKSHIGHKIFWSDKTDNILITVIGYTNFWLDYLTHFTRQYFEASTDTSRNKTPFLDKGMSPYYTDKLGTPSSANASNESYYYIKNVLNNYALLLDELAKVVDHFHTAGNVYERKEFSYNPNVVSKLFLAIDEYFKDQSIYEYVFEEKLYIERLTTNNCFKLKSEIKEMVKNLGVKANINSAKKSDENEAKVVSMIICTAIASFLHNKSTQIKKYIKFFDTEYNTLKSLDNQIHPYASPEDASSMMNYSREYAKQNYLNNPNRNSRN